MNKKILLIFSAIFLVLIIFGYVQFSQNQKYELYLSNHVSKKTADLSIAILRNNDLLKQVIETKSVSKIDAEKLAAQFENVRELSQDLYNIASPYYLAKVSHSKLNNKTASVAAEVHRYIYNLNMNTGEKESNVLIDKHLNIFNKIKTINDKWLNVIKANVKGISDGELTIKYYDLYHDIAVTKDYWVDIVKEFSKIEYNEREIERWKKEFAN